MITILPLILFIIHCLGIPENNHHHVFNKTTLVADIPLVNLTTDTQLLDKIKIMLHAEAPTLNADVINKILMTLRCADAQNIYHNNILTVIDYSMPSSEKRLWIFDLEKNKLLFHTYVSHGIKSGTLLSSYFSNNFNSKASSIGVYNTEKSYRGRHGISLKLYGLDKDFNDNAYNRFIVLHGTWYVNEDFVKKYGRVGRSWGCPTLPLDLTQPIIDTIKDRSLLIAYYPSDAWLLKSPFLNCHYSENHSPENIKIKGNLGAMEEEQREPILFADMNGNSVREENEPVVVVSAQDYQKVFNTSVPLNRMLRRQINHNEYIALSYEEFRKLGKSLLNIICFVIPDVQLLRGYYVTEMKMITLGKITTVVPEKNLLPVTYTLHFEQSRSVLLKSTDRFIRWVGL